MTRRTLPLVLAVAGLLCLLGRAPVASAVEAPTSGWWSRLATTSPADEVPAALPAPAPTTPGTIPAGGTVPEGNLLVEGTPEGATAVAAARYVLADGESSPSLTIAVGEGSTVSSESTVLACKAAAPWTAPEQNPGPWDAKPLVDASRCVNGVIADDLATISFGLQPLVSGDELDVVLVPGKLAAAAPPAGTSPAPVEADGSTFRLVFPAPTTESLAVMAGSGFEPGSGEVVVPPAAPTSPPSPSSASTSLELAPSPPSAKISTPPIAGIGEPVATPALEPQDLAPSVPDVGDAVPVAATDGAERTIGFILLALAALAAGWAYLTHEDAATIGLGRFRTDLPAGAAVAGAAVTGVPQANPTVGGLSRFARERTTPPTPLS